MIWLPIVLSVLVVGSVFFLFWKWHWEWRRHTAGPNETILDFALLIVDLFASGAGAVALMLLTKFLGINALFGPAYIVTIVVGLLLAVALFCVVFAKLHFSRNWRRKLIAYACICGLVVACFFRPND